MGLQMKVLFDHQIFYYRYGGAAKYFSMLLASLPCDTWECTALMPYSEYLKAVPGMRTHKKRFRGDSVIMEYMNRPYTSYVARKQAYDVFHQTNFGTYCINDIGKRPMVTTYHDTNLSTIDPHPDIVERQRISLQRADAIICVSENTKKEMLTLFDVDEKKVHVVYHGIELPRMETLQLKRVIEPEYILYVGRRSRYKNFTTLARSFADIHKTHKDIRLVCTMAPFSEDEHALFRRLGIEDAVIFIDADEEMMKCLYKDALVFVFPSLHEGFGMPILEAWSCHCPVILSQASCFPEIGKEAALYFEPENSDELTQRLLSIIDDEVLRNKLISLGNSEVRNYSWQRCAQEHIDIYSSLVL